MRATQQRSQTHLYGSGTASKPSTAAASSSMLVPLMCLTGSVCLALSKPEWAALFFVLAAMSFSAVIYEDHSSSRDVRDSAFDDFHEISLAPFVLFSGIFFTVVGFASGIALLALFG